MNPRHISRRNFLTQTCGAVGTLGIASTVWNLRAIAAAVNQATAPGGGLITTNTGGVSAGDFKALVCIFLYGGNDSNNLLVPRDDATYAKYASARGGLALSQGALLPITAATSDGHTYGLHPSLPELHTLFGGGKVALMANVGTLVAPVTRANYLNNSAQLPPQLFSHASSRLSSIAESSSCPCSSSLDFVF